MIGEIDLRTQLQNIAYTVGQRQNGFFRSAFAVGVGLLVLVQVLRFTGARRPPTAKPDYSATTLIRRRTDTDDRG